MRFFWGAAMATKDRDERFEQGELLYERFGKPLEREHWGEYVAIAPMGGYVVGADLKEVSRNALKKFGSGTFVFKVGDKSVGRIR